MRRDARVVAFSLIFAKLFSSCDEFDGQSIDELKKPDDRTFARDLVTSFEENKQGLEELVKKYVSGYEIERIYKVDLALVYTALCEIQFLHTPPQVAINEALEIAKIYSTEKSSKFVHGLLSSILKGEGL